MQPIRDCQPSVISGVQYVLTDFDDTVTTNGLLKSAAVSAMEQLQNHHFKVIIVTGRPAGWCDMICRMFPVDAVIGENGAFYFSYDRQTKSVHRQYQRTASERARDQLKLLQAFEEVKKQFDVELASDQQFRVSDIAIDVCEDRPPLNSSDVGKIISLLQSKGGTVKLSSIHINAWFGAFDKMSMARRLLSEQFGANLSDRGKAVYVGDSPNDEPMFKEFGLSFGVRNILDFEQQLVHKPTFVASLSSGDGFCEIADLLVKARSAAGSTIS